MHSWRYPEHFDRDQYLASSPPKARLVSDEKLKAVADLPIESYLAEMGEAEKAIIMGVKFPKTMGTTIPNDYIADLVKKYPGKFYGFCSVEPDEPGAIEELERSIQDLGLIGLKLSPVYQNFFPNDHKYWPLYQKAQQLKIPVAFHTSYAMLYNCRMVCGDVRLLDDVAMSFRDLTIIVCHFGWYHYEDTAHLITKHLNVFTDMSMLSMASSLNRRMIRPNLPTVTYEYFHWYYPLLYYLSIPFGFSYRIMFATDFPAVSPVTDVDLLRSINTSSYKLGLPPIPEKAIGDILHENWKKVFNL